MASAESFGKIPLAQKPLMLVVFYGNPDYHITVTRELEKFRDYFTLHLLTSDVREPAYAWTSDVTIERVGLKIKYGDRSFAEKIWTAIDYLLFMLIVRRRIGSLKPAIVYTLDSWAYTAVSMVGSRGAPLVFKTLDQDPPEASSRFGLKRWVDKYALRQGPRASLVVLLDKDRANYYLRRSGDKRFPLIVPSYASINLVTMPNDFEALIDRRFDRREILYTGVVKSTIAIEESVQALGLLGSGYQLTIYGLVGPDETARLESLAKSVSANLSMRGWVRGPDLIANTMEAAVGLVLFKPISDNYQNMATATTKLYEYAARGIPVVVPDTRSFRDHLQHEEWVAYAGMDNPQSIANGIESFLKNPERYRQASRAARRAFEDRYNYEAVFPPLLERLTDLCDQTRGSAS